MHFNPENAIRRLARAQMAHPLRFLACAAILTALAGVYAAGLKFDSSYEALLPVGAPEVKNLDDIRARTGGVRQLVIAIGGGDEQKRLRFGRRIAPAL